MLQPLEDLYSISATLRDNLQLKSSSKSWVLGSLSDAILLHKMSKFAKCGRLRGGNCCAQPLWPTRSAQIGEQCQQSAWGTCRTRSMQRFKCPQPLSSQILRIRHICPSKIAGLSWLASTERGAHVHSNGKICIYSAWTQHGCCSTFPAELTEGAKGLGVGNSSKRQYAKAISRRATRRHVWYSLTHLFVVCFARMFFNAPSRPRLGGKVNSYVHKDHDAAGYIEGAQRRVEHVANVLA